MPVTVTMTARLSEPLNRGELSRIWESERAVVNVPEIVMEPRGNDVMLRFQSAGIDPTHSKLRARFEEAVHRYHPELTIAWPEFDTTRAA